MRFTLWTPAACGIASLALLLAGFPASARPCVDEPCLESPYIFGPVFGPGFPGGPDTRYGVQTLILNEGQFTLQATAMGAYYSNNNGLGPPLYALHFARDQNYPAQSCEDYHCDTRLGAEENAHNFFVFDLSGVTGPIFSAALSLGNPPGGTSSGGVHYAVWDVTTPISVLQADNLGALALPTYLDLGSGRSFGAVDVDPSPDGAQILIPLTPMALDSLMAAEGGLWAVGGSVIPEPGTWLLMVLGLGVVGAAMRTRIARQRELDPT